VIHSSHAGVVVSESSETVRHGLVSTSTQKLASDEDTRQGTRYIIKRSYLGEAAAET